MSIWSAAKEKKEKSQRGGADWGRRWRDRSRGRPVPGPLPDFVELQEGGGGGALAGALPRAPNGIRASSDVPLLTSEEGAKMDLLEQAEPW